jgi:hypothetical protein
VAVDHIARSLIVLRRVVFVLIAVMLIMGVGLSLLGWHVLQRQGIADRRNRQTITTAQHNREAICAVLRSIPADRRSRAVRKALMIDDCASAPVPSPHLATVPSAHPSVPVVPPSRPPTSTTVVIRPTPRPTVTETKTAKPQPTPHPHPSASPDPVASCLRNLINLKACR